VRANVLGAMRGRFAVMAGVVVGMLVGACTSGGEPDTSTGAGATVTSGDAGSSWPALGGGVQQPPVLVLSSHCTGMCLWADPPGFADVLVYGDGTVVTSTLIAPSGGSRAVELREYHPSAAALAALYDAAVATGLLVEGTSVVGDSGWCADCPDTVFLSRLGDGPSRVSAPCMCTESATIEGDSAPRRNALRALQDLMNDLVPNGEGTVLEPSSYVLFVYGVGDHQADLEAAGVDLATFAPFSDSSLCGMVPMANPLGAAIIGSGVHYATWVQFGNEVRAVYARPAYPHEHTCADIDS
jgi:hypothetical protein